MALSALCNKTVFLLDHSHWMREPSGFHVEIEAGTEGNPPGNPGRSSGGRGFFPSFIPPVTKTLWTPCVETVLEYGRVVTDLFADRQIVVGLCQWEGSRSQVHWLNSWERLSDGAFQQYLAERFGVSGPPSLPPLPHVKSNVSTLAVAQMGIRYGIEALAQPTPNQLSFMQGKSSMKAINKGRIVVFTSFTPQSIGKGSTEDLEEFFVDEIDKHNRNVQASDHLLPILECDLEIISIHPLGKQKFGAVSPKVMRELPQVSPTLRYAMYVLDTEQVAEKMVDMCVSHQELVSTIVTGIPMKEEQNAQHSSNYDVKLWHPRISASSAGTGTSSPTGESLVLKWSSPLTPKPGGVGIHHSVAAVRITPVEINARPTTCLASFLMGGRSVWLEIQKKGKGISHLLTSHGGEMWLHLIESARNVLEDPPSISEGVGGRVTDYRIPDFADFIRMNVLVPYPRNFRDHVESKKEREAGNPFVRRRSSVDDSKKPLDMAKERLHRKTNFWPQTISGSLLFPMHVHIESLLRLMPLDKMTDIEKVECDKCIWSLMSVEARGEPPVPSGYHKKGQKRDEQWRACYSELECFIKANLHSENHKKVLECFLESRRAESKVDSRNSSHKTQDMEKALATLASFGTTATFEAATDSPASPPPVTSTGKSTETRNPQTAQSLLSLWTTKTEKKDFRVLTNTKLYAHKDKEKDAEAADTNNGVASTGNGRKPEAVK